MPDKKEYLIKAGDGKFYVVHIGTVRDESWWVERDGSCVVRVGHELGSFVDLEALNKAFWR